MQRATKHHAWFRHFPIGESPSCILEDLAKNKFFKRVAQLRYPFANEKGGSRSWSSDVLRYLEVHRLLEFASGLKTDDLLTADFG